MLCFFPPIIILGNYLIGNKSATLNSLVMEACIVRSKRSILLLIIQAV